MEIELYEIVMIKTDIKNIKSGSIGTVVEIWNDGEGYEVEFLDEEGNVIDCISLSKTQVRKLTDEEIKKLD